jgi:hypothetical protein
LKPGVQAAQLASQNATLDGALDAQEEELQSREGTIEMLRAALAAAEARLQAAAG